MRGNEFLDKMELIDPAYVEAADKKPYKKKRIWLKWGVTAACLLLMVGSALAIRQQLIPDCPDSPDPKATNIPGTDEPITTEIPSGNDVPTSTPPAPVATNPPISLHPDAITIPQLQVNAGFEGYMCYDISELDNGNPWSEDMNINSLPVYKNLAFDATGAGIPKGLNEEEMVEQLEFTVTALNLEILETEVIRDGFVIKEGEMIADDTPTRLIAITDKGEITVSADGTITYRLPEKGLSLPAEYHFTNHETTEAEAQKALSYLITTYKQLLNYEEPLGESFGDYDILGEFNRNYIAYDISGDYVTDILNYNFGRVYFYPADDNNLYLIRINNGLSVAEKIMDYPIITTEEATARLTAGNYQTSVPIAFPGEEAIGRVELVYRTGRLEEILLPYYRFYVLLSDSISESATNRGLKTYGAYYVPALPAEYIVNMPTYDGHFN